MTRVNHTKVKSAHMEVKIIKPFKGEFPVTQSFGADLEWYVKIAGYPHNGMDFAMPTGTPILACDDGVLTYADNVPDADGCGINITHEWGYVPVLALKQVGC
ncbi:MAG: Peptidase M23 [candidate division WWE3 bacterium GW2011_GWC2_44_9]|uniref:Peptidase M23 n=2 Tax=Katanobacteria TaxID=422282 RepID=A0A0G1NK17_UNCKA|nr:MAG: Peptidase M23 [candidate division WWE3 bacterium GW2011_GWC2_44_9]